MFAPFGDDGEGELLSAGSLRSPAVKHGLASSMPFRRLTFYARSSAVNGFDINLMYIVLEEGKLCLTAGD